MCQEEQLWKVLSYPCIFWNLMPQCRVKVRPMEIWGAQQYWNSEYYATHSCKVLQTIFTELIDTKPSKPSSLEEGYAEGLNPHQKRMQPPALQHTSPLPSLWDRTSCRGGPLMPAHHLSMTQGWGFLNTSQTCADLDGVHSNINHPYNPTKYQVFMLTNCWQHINT